MKSNVPQWSEIFAARPDLEAPGYQEALKATKDKNKQIETDRIKLQMQEIQKEKLSAKNKSRTRNKRLKFTSG